MNNNYSIINIEKLKKTIEKEYKIKINYINHLRSMIGHVFIIENQKQKYILKINRPINELQTLQSIEIMEYLYENKYPVVEIVKTKNSKSYINLDTIEGNSLGIIFKYIDGKEPDITTKIIDIGKQIGWFHKIMEKYPKNLIERGKEFYIDRFIKILKEHKYDRYKIRDLQIYGHELWNNLEKSPKGFCHGYLHLGNMFQTEPNRFILFDFDTASYSHPIIDIATLCDTTNFNNLVEKDFDKISKRFDNFSKGYSIENSISVSEINNIFNFIPIRHYELIATITINEKSTLSSEFLDQQYEWFLKWKNFHNNKI